MPGEGLGIGTGLLEGAINQATNQQQYQQEQNLMNIQHGNQQELNQQGHDLQFKMWQKTNYPEQVRMMKAAGLNPALMYKGAGPGGTTGSQGGGTASKGNAPQAWKANPQTLMMGLEMKRLEKTIEGIEESNEGTRIDNAIKKGDDAAGRGQLEINKLDAETKEILARKTKLDNEAAIQEFEKKIAKAEADRTEKGMIKGDHLGNLLEAIGLDPVNNEGDRILLNTMLTTWYGSKVAGELMGSIPGLKELRGLLKGKNKVGY